MPVKYIATDFDNVILDFGNGTSRPAAKCHGHAEAVVKLLNDARYLNDVKRRYTAAARKIAAAETFPGFEWIETVED